MKVFVVSRGLVDHLGNPVLDESIVGVRSTWEKAIELIQKMDDGIGRHWDIAECEVDFDFVIGVTGFGQETWKSHLRLPS